MAASVIPAQSDSADTAGDTATIALSNLLPGGGEGFSTPELVDALLDITFELAASDLHLLPSPTGLQVAWRVDGVLHPAGELPQEVAANVVARFKVLADLLTYETSAPQEGRLKRALGTAPVRVSTMPTLFGEKLVARVLPAGEDKQSRLSELSFPPQVKQLLEQSLRQTSGLLLIVGPAGSGKTTTGYAVVREIQAVTSGARNIASLEDPVEAVLPGVAQSQAAPHAGFDLLTGLRALVRQDPEVIYLGEVRDAETANLAYQAALTGQLVVTTFHAGDCADAVARMIDMGIPPYVVRGATRAIVAQRLVRQVCSACQNQSPKGCRACRGAGYRGRLVVAEAADLARPELAQAIVPGVDQQALRSAFQSQGCESLISNAAGLLSAGLTSAAEIDRVLGLGASQGGAVCRG